MCEVVHQIIADLPDPLLAEDGAYGEEEGHDDDGHEQGTDEQQRQHIAPKHAAMTGDVHMQVMGRAREVMSVQALPIDGSLGIRPVQPRFLAELDRVSRFGENAIRERSLHTVDPKLHAEQRIQHGDLDAVLDIRRAFIGKYASDHIRDHGFTVGDILFTPCVRGGTDHFGRHIRRIRR